MPEKRVTVWVQRFNDRSTLVLQWIDPDTGRRKSKSAGTADPKEAEALRGDLEADLNHGRHRETSRMSWERFRELFEQEFLPNRRPNTQRNYTETLDSFEKHCQPTTLRGISGRTISAFTAALWKAPGKGNQTMLASTIRVRLQFLHTVFSWAAEQKLIAECPGFPSVKVPRKRPQPVATESFERLVDRADLQLKIFLFCGWYAGLRLNEALALEWEENDRSPWVDMDSNRIWLPAGFVKGAEDQWVPLDPVLREALLALPRLGPKVFHFAGKDGVPLTDVSLSNRIGRLAKKAGVRLTMKSLRRGFGCRYAATESAHVLQRLMRHASIKTTLDFYVNVDDAVMQAVLGERDENRLRNTTRNNGSSPALADDGNMLSDGDLGGS
jgi:integrase